MTKLINKGIRFVKRVWRGGVIRGFQTISARRHYYCTMSDVSTMIVSGREEPQLTIPETIPQVCKSQDGTNYYVHNVGPDLELETAISAKVFLTKLKDATCFVYSDVILLSSGECLYELKDYGDIKDVGIFLDEILLKDTDRWCKIKRCRQHEILPKAIKVGGLFGFNYYHWTFQLIPRLFETESIDPSIPLLVDASVRDTPSMREMLSALNICHRPIIYMNYGIAYTVNELYIVSSPNICLPNINKSLRGRYNGIQWCSYSPNTLRQLREALLPLASSSQTAKRCYICRGRASKRRAYNEEECYNSLQHLGFEKVYPEELSLSEQISTFQNAEIIVAPSGAALTNLLFIHPSSHIIIMTNSFHQNSYWIPLVCWAGGYFYQVSAMASEDIQRNFYIDATILQHTVNMVCNIKTVTGDTL